MHKIKKGDLVKVITGKDKDKTGKVLSVNVKKNTVLVEGCNMVTKHTKPSAANQQGGIIHQEGALDISNVMLVPGMACVCQKRQRHRSCGSAAGIWASTMKDF